MKRSEARMELEQLQKTYPMLGTLPKEKGAAGTIIFSIVMGFIAFLLGGGLIQAGLLGYLAQFFPEEESQVLPSFGLPPLALLIGGFILAALCIILMVVKIKRQKTSKQRTIDRWAEQYVKSGVTDEIEKRYRHLVQMSRTGESCKDCVHCLAANEWSYDGDYAYSDYTCELRGTIHGMSDQERIIYINCPDCEWKN